MCTLTWWRAAGGSYEVFFNRDEKRTRSAAEHPRVHQRSGVSFLAPIDPDGGGTWLLANQHGLVVCLLNRWQEEEDPPSSSSSRGQLVMEMGSLQNVPAVEERLRRGDLAKVRPFTMVGFDRVGERAWSWDGRSLTIDRTKMPMCSSSFHFEEVAAARQVRFEELRCAHGEGPELLETFHADTGLGASAFTVRMTRSDAQTVSRSRVKVGPQVIQWTYVEEPRELKGQPRVDEVELRWSEPQRAANGD